jgi:hypothetical protein
LKEITISFSRIFSSKHNVAPLYWSLPTSVLCQLLRQIMVLRGSSLISLLFSLVKDVARRKIRAASAGDFFVMRFALICSLESPPSI